jgi:LPXTG-motif cell wall-anchored protein
MDHPSMRARLGWSLRRWLAAMAIVVTVVGWTGDASAAWAAAGSSCADESYLWTGAATLGGAGATSVDTGVVVPVVVGTTVTVVGVSADGLAPDGRATALDVTVGGTAATPGATVVGGAVVISTTSPSALRVSGATVVVSRCAEVEVLTPVQRPLPATGVSEQVHLMIGGSMVGVGALMVTTGRRRRSAR